MSVIDWILIGLLAIGSIAALVVLMASYIMARKKIRKEIGLLRQHLAYRPGRAVKRLHFGEYGKVYNDRSDDSNE